MWDFETEAEFQIQLDWVDAFVREEVEPLDFVLGHRLRRQGPAAQQACQAAAAGGAQTQTLGLPSGPGARRPGLRPGQAGAAQRNPRPVEFRPDRFRLPGARLRQRRDPSPLRDRQTQASNSSSPFSTMKSSPASP